MSSSFGVGAPKVTAGNLELAVSVRGLCKSYVLYDKPADRLKQMIWRNHRVFGREVRVLDDVSFDVRKGETIGIIGLNGAGKSTLLQIICGTVAPSAGTVALNGRAAALLELGAGFNPEFSGRENVFLNAAILGLSDADISARLHSILNFADIGEFIDAPVKTYSSGMYVRLAFAVAAHVDPEILIVDEALSVGDFLFQQKCNKFMTENLSGTTKIFVTHDFGAVTRLAERVLVLDKGRVIFDGDPSTAIERYQIAARGGSSEGKGEHGTSKLLAGKDILPAATTISKGPVDPRLEWARVPSDKCSGLQRASFDRFHFLVAGAADRQNISNGDELTLHALITCASDIDAPIIGYQIQDRFGAVIFGENSKSFGRSLSPLKAGTHELTLSLEWPVLAPGQYSVTLGIGNGDNALLHVVECWAHNIVVLHSSSSVPVHGVFNVPIKTLKLGSIGR